MSKKRSLIGEGLSVNLSLIITPMLDMAFQFMAFFIMTFQPLSEEKNITGRLLPLLKEDQEADRLGRPRFGQTPDRGPSGFALSILHPAPGRVPGGQVQGNGFSQTDSTQKSRQLTAACNVRRCRQTKR